MRLLSISNSLLVPYQGSGYVALGYADGLRQRGWTVNAFGSGEVDPWPRLGRARSWRLALGMLQCACNNLRRARYDIVEFYGGEAWLAISALARRPARRFLIVSHSNGLEPYCREQLQQHLGADTLDGGRRRWYQVRADTLMASGFRRADALVTVSEFELSFARRHAYQQDSRLLAIDNPLPGEFLALPLQLERNAIVGYVGSWIPRKGIDLIKADMSRVLRDFPECRLRLIGVQSCADVAAGFAADVRTRIEVVPFLANRRELQTAYSECAIVIAPSAYESFGMTVAEAMACGCAVVASRTGFAAGLQDGIELSVLPAAASPHLYSRVRELLLDPPRRKRIATAGYRHVQRLRWSDAVDRLAVSYESWFAQRRANR